MLLVGAYVDNGALSAWSSRLEAALHVYAADCMLTYMLADVHVSADEISTGCADDRSPRSAAMAWPCRDRDVPALDALDSAISTENATIHRTSSDPSTADLALPKVAHRGATG